MNLSRHAVVELSENEVKELIAECVRNTFKYAKCDANDVTIKVEKEWLGYGLGEYTECVCKGASVKCKFE